MFDIQLRPLKDVVFDPLCEIIPASITPLHLTVAAFGSGLLCSYAASQGSTVLAVTFWVINRVLDCLDGAVARKRDQASDLGGFLDLLSDFIVYSLIPISIAWSADRTVSALMAVCMLEISFHINNFILFYVAALAEKSRSKNERTEELTSVMMRPALVEGAESGIIFTAMLLFPDRIKLQSYAMTIMVSLGILQRSLWTIGALS